MNTSQADLSAFHQLMRKGQINLLNLTLNENLSQCELKVKIFHAVRICFSRMTK